MYKYIEAKVPYLGNKEKFIISNDINIKYMDELIVSYNNNLYLVRNLSKKMEVIDDIIDNKVIRLATNKDIILYNDNISKARKCKEDIQKIIKNFNLIMNLTDVFLSFDGKKMLVIYTSDNRVDFRELIKEILKVYRLKIELKQIGVRDKAQVIGGFGICVQQLCCKRFLKDFDSINISLAKKQKLALNPNRINGVCGRLMCCLKYEKKGASSDSTK